LLILRVLFAKTLNAIEVVDLVEENAFNNHLTRVKKSYEIGDTIYVTQHTPVSL